MKNTTTLLGLLALVLQICAQSRPQIDLQAYVSGLDQPVAMAHAGDERLFVCEQPGRIRVIDAQGQLLPTPFLDIEEQVVTLGNEQGLLGLAFHPNFNTNGYFYVNYTGNGDSTTLSRFQVDTNDPNSGLTNSEKVLLKVAQPYRNHNAGDLAFGPDGYLYMALGDGGAGNDPEQAGQDRSSLLGTIIRLDVDQGDPYALPPDNPFVQQPNARPEIWSWGWRNPWRFSFDRQTGDMWIADVGQGAREEISREAAGSPGGLNYGWRCLEGTLNTGLCGNLPTSEAPVFEYGHGGNTGRSVTGGYVYRGDDYPVLQGHYVFGDYVSGRLWTIYPDGSGGYDTTSQGPLLSSGRLSAFGQAENGELYAASRNEGTIYQVVASSTADLQQAAREPLRLGPLPWEDQLQVTLPLDPITRIEVQISDLTGRVVYSERMRGQATFTLDRQELPAGLYVLEVRTGSLQWSEKVMVGQ